MQRRHFLKYGAITGTTGVIAACSNVFGTSSKSSSALKPIKIAILTWVGYSPFFVAKDQNFFAKYGLEAEILKIEDATPRRTALAKQDVQFSLGKRYFFSQASYRVTGNLISFSTPRLNSMSNPLKLRSASRRKSQQSSVNLAKVTANLN